MKTYIAVISTINNTMEVNGKKGIVGNMSLEYIAQKAGKSVSTVSNHIKKLEEMKLLYVSRSKANVANGAFVHKETNAYGLYENKAYIDYYSKRTCTK